MGNTVPPRMCREVGTVVDAGTGVLKRPPRDVVAGAAARRRVAAVTSPCKHRDYDDEEEEEAVTRAVPGRRRGEAPRAAPAATAVTVKIVMRRKDAEALVATLQQQGARERKARMAELEGELCGAEGRGGGGASPASCRDAWRPRLAPIQEIY